MAITGHADLLQDLRSTLGDACVRTPDAEHPLTEHLHDWRGRYRGRALAIVSPRSTQDVATAIRLCAKHLVAIVPQGGNTSLVGGSVPDSSGKQIVLSLKRLNQVLDIDPDNLSMTAQAGCTLAEVQNAAQAAGLIFPLSLASEGTCTIGGVLATNAGGTQVLRYGTARELCLGLEVVTAQGEVWSRLNGLRKDNTGYDLRNLIIGSEGTLGVITSATLRLYPAPRGQATALVPCADPTEAVAVLRRARIGLDAGLTACELMAPMSLSLVSRHLPKVAQELHGIPLPSADPVAEMQPWWLLLEVSSAASESDAQERLAGLLQDASEGVHMAQTLTQRAAMWRLRDAIPQAEKLEGRMVKHDIGLPTSKIAGFLDAMGRDLSCRWPGCNVVCFGHLGDGNLHFNVQPAAGHDSLQSFEDFEHEVNTVVFDEVQDLGGTISAEHGIGELRKHELASRHPASALDAMRAIKQALDPDGLLNPGRVLAAR